MTRVIQGCLLVLGLIFLSGCSFKEPQVVVETVYVKEEPFKFVDVDSKGMSIDAGSKELQKMCTPLVLEAGYQYRKVIDLYEFQIDSYRTLHEVRDEK